MKKKTEDGQQARHSYPPVVSVLGHVDHGKTTLLDAIRKTNLADSEAGGITQSIGASTVELTHEGNLRKITFIDTPGHEAFSNMRGHGVTASDIVLLVIALDDGVKPQTKESIQTIQNSKLPYIVVFTKSDTPGANEEKLKQEVLKNNISLESHGGSVPYISVSAKNNSGIKELLDLILIVYDISEVKKSETDSFLGVVIESQLDKRRGPISAVIAKSGTLNRGTKIFVNEKEVGKVRALFDTSRQQVQSAYPGEAIEILGIADVLMAGSVVSDTPSTGIKEEVKSNVLVDNTQHDLIRRIQMQEKDKLPLIIKTRTSGEYEAIAASLPDDVEVVFEGRGDILVSDVMMAKDFSAIVVGFNVSVEKQAEVIAQDQNIFYRTYLVIYKMLEEIEDASQMLLEKGVKKIAGKAKVLAKFEGSSGVIIGIKVLEGRAQVGDFIQREDESENIAKVKIIKQEKESVKQVGKDKECGITTEPAIDFTIGDVLIFHTNKK